MNIKNLNKKFYTLFGVVAVLAVFSIFLTIETAVDGSAVSALEKQEKQLLNQKQDLESTLVKTLSNSELQEKSTELGFSKPTNLVYINDSLPVAKLP